MVKLQRTIDLHCPSTDLWYVFYLHGNPACQMLIYLLLTVYTRIIGVMLMGAGCMHAVYVCVCQNVNDQDCVQWGWVINCRCFVAIHLM